MSKILVSSCLLSEKVRYDGKVLKYDTRLHRLHQAGIVLGFCPEVAGGLDVPRVPAEIENGSVEDVLIGRGSILRRDGIDVTNAFIDGANQAVELVKIYGIPLAILKSKSPSCGIYEVYDGTFSGHLQKGQGLTAYLLHKQGVKLFNEHEIDAALRAYLGMGFKLPDDLAFELSE